MRQLNLLPWRDRHKRRQDLVLYVVLILVLILNVGFILSKAIVAHRQLEAYTERRVYMGQQLQLLNGQITQREQLQAEQRQLSSRMHWLAQLSQKNLQILSSLHRLAQHTPASLAYSQLIIGPREVLISGQLESLPELPALLQALIETELFDQAELRSMTLLERLDQPSLHQLELRLQLSSAIEPERSVE